MKGTCIQQETLRLWANLTPLFLMFFERLRFSTVLVSCHLRRLGTNVQKHVPRASAVFILSQKIQFYFHQKSIWMTLARRLHWLPSRIVGNWHLRISQKSERSSSERRLNGQASSQKGMRHHESCLRVFSWGMQMCNTCCFITFTPGENLSRLGRLLSDLFCIWLGALCASSD